MSPQGSNQGRRIVISEFLDEASIAQLRTLHEVDYGPELVDAPEELARRLASASALIVRNRTQVSRALLEAAPCMKVVGRLGVGLDNIDLAACHDRGVVVHPATGANARSVAEYALAMTLVTLRGAYHHSDLVAAGNWPRSALMQGREAEGRTLGIVGFGQIGQLTGKLAQAVGLQVIATDPAHGPEVWAAHGVEGVSLETLLARADAVSLHTPLNETTRGLFDAALLARMRPGAVLINTARGGIVDEASLARALRRGQLGGAAIDVFAREPLPPGGPLTGLPNVWLTPHIAGLSREANARVSAMVVSRVLETLARHGD